MTLDRDDTFVKTLPEAPAGFFETEAAGLRWLADAEAGGGVGVVRVVAAGRGRIELERLRQVRPRREAARAFGSALARTHRAGAPAFGSPPPGGGERIYIGRRPQRAFPTPHWGTFYANDRVLPFVESARASGNLTAEDAEAVEEACELIGSGVFDGHETPARLHGDLWNGNVVWSEDGVVLIDPAAHGGHRETDLAMLDLFGCPFLDDVIQAYESVHPLEGGWRERIPVHRLHPLAVHAAGHGPSYGAALGEAARRTIALARR